jgi:hypothetical protein
VGCRMIRGPGRGLRSDVFNGCGLQITIMAGIRWEGKGTCRRRKYTHRVKGSGVSDEKPRHGGTTDRTVA